MHDLLGQARHWGSPKGLTVPKAYGHPMENQAGWFSEGSDGGFNNWKFPRWNLDTVVLFVLEVMYGVKHLWWTWE